MRNIVVTGAATGVGAALCRRLARPGVRLFIHTRSNREKLASVAEFIAAAGAEYQLSFGDLSDPSVTTKIIEGVVPYGYLDGLISNAGFADKTEFTELDDAGLDHSLGAMPGAFHRLCQGVLPLLRSAKAGRVVAISSFVAHRFRLGDVSMPASAAAKATLEALAKVLAVSLSRDGITVNCVAPGFIAKENTAHAALSEQDLISAAAKIPLGRFGKPDEIAGLIEFLLSDDAAYITGQTIHIDGGITL